ncbi:MAG: ThiF family adenylyltransferase [Candidatus Thorarchaeota archaeon]
MFNDKEKEKYNRQIIITNFSLDGQEKLKTSKVLVIGLGGLGSSAAYYLACAGIGYLGILDKDKVELSNLNRQILHQETNIGESKTRSASQKLSKLNQDIKIKEYNVNLNADNSEKILSNFDFIVEASDNFETKFLVNDICVKLGIPFVIGGVYQFEGQMMTVVPGKTACYRCISKEIPEIGSYPTTSEGGVIGTIAGLFGIIEANEAIKYLVFKDIEQLLSNKMLYIDMKYNTFEIFKIEKDDRCITCS